MVYVFGIDGVPIFEMQFILTILLLIGLIFILIELRRLTKILSQEKQDLLRFEQDLAKYEEPKHKPSEKFIAHVKNALSRGITWSTVEYTLYKDGWDRKSVENLKQKIVSDEKNIIRT